MGPQQCQETIRTALAMGADRAILIEATTDINSDIEPLSVAKLIAEIVKDEKPSLILCGKQAIDNDMNATGQMISALLQWSQATFASKVEVNSHTAQVTREVDGGLQKIELNLPAIISVDLRLNEPRYASLPNIMKAKRKPLDIKKPEELGLSIENRLKIITTKAPPDREAGIKVESVEDLISKLKEESGVI